MKSLLSKRILLSEKKFIRDVWNIIKMKGVGSDGHTYIRPYNIEYNPKYSSIIPKHADGNFKQWGEPWFNLPN